MREPYFSDSDMTLYQGDAIEVLRDLPAGSVHMACTSPPFFGLRDYGTGAWEGGDEGCDHVAPAGKSGGERADRTFTLGEIYRDICGKCGARRIDSQIGLESSPDEWAARLVDVFREVRRVLRDDGTLWVECGDSYNSRNDGSFGNWDSSSTGKPTSKRSGGTNSWTGTWSGAKAKDLIGQPWLLAFALRADGWYLRSCIIWAKPNAMPESVTDRPTTGHSYVFLFSKKPRYFWDQEALKDPTERNGDRPGGKSAWGKADGAAWSNGVVPVSKNARTVWTIPTEPNALAICRVCDAYWQGGAPREHCGEPVVQHFAAFPRELVRRMILAGTSERGVCAECGAPWVREEEIGESDYSRLMREQGHGWTDMDATAVANGTVLRAGEGGHTRTAHGTVPSLKAATRSTLSWKRTCSCECRSLHNCSGGAHPVPATILDPFSGSGTTLLVARSLGRHAIGVELNERYCAMTKARTHQLSVLG